MTAAVKAIAWELWSRNRWALISVLIGLPITLIPGHEWFRVFQALFFMFAITILYWSFCYVEVDARGRHAGFPSRMFVLPLRTTLLAGLPMILGGCVVALFYVFWSQVALPIWGVRISASWVRVHALTLVTMMFSLQAIVWSFYRFPWIRLFVLVTAIIGTGTLGLLVPAEDFRKMTEGQVEITLGAIALLAFVGGVTGVARDRRGEWEGWTQRAIDGVLGWLPRGRAKLKSAADAQLWFEWRGKALFSCFIMLIAMLFPLIMWPVPGAINFQGGAAGSFYAALPIMTLCAAWAFGFNLARTDYWSGNVGLSPFIAARPLTSGDIVVAKFKAAALVTMTVTLLFVLFAVPVFNIPHWWLSSEDHKFLPFAAFVRQNPELVRTIGHPIVVLSALFVMWATMVDGLAIALKPRRSRIGQTILQIGLVIGVLILIGWCMETARGRRILIDSLPWGSGLIITWKLITTSLAFIRVRRFYSRGQWFGVLGLWLTTALLIGWTVSIVWTEISPVNRAIVFLASCLLPGAALARAPLNLDRSRHA